MGKKQNRGFFISLEGTEGSGKSTLIRNLENSLKQNGWSVVTTREPGGCELAESIRSFILGNSMSPMTELFLYEAARAEHLVQTILPALQAGKVVLCDRFTDSTLAYQGEARGLDWKTIERLNTIATQGVRPDLTVFLDIDPEKGLRRALDPNRFELEGVTFQARVRKGFLKAMKLAAEKSRLQAYPRWIKLDAGNTTPENLTSRVMKEIKRRIQKVNP